MVQFGLIDARNSPRGMRLADEWLRCVDQLKLLVKLTQVSPVVWQLALLDTLFEILDDLRYFVERH